MTATYRTRGRLVHPVSDLSLAREYLRTAHGDEPIHMEQHVYPEHLRPLVHSADWDLLDEQTWQVTLVTHELLTDEQAAGLSDWICGQNSDGLGEGFEQQAFADCWPRNRWGDIDDEQEDEHGFMASFDWQTNDCHLTLVTQ